VDSLERAGMMPQEIDLIITVSCTGFMIPSLDAHLINELGFRPDVKRLPITELGCAAGGAALARAAEFIRAFPGASVLVIAVEIPSLTFQRGDFSQANLISTVLFGDGAAAAVVTGQPGPGPRVVGTDSYLFPHSLDAMGFDLKDSGFHIVLSKDVPQLIREQIKELLTRFLARHNLTKEQLSAFILHPGGQKLLLYIEEELGLSRCDTQFSWDVLSEYGNLSSASVLFVLHECLKKRQFESGDYGIMAAFGPGFSSEMLLLQWT
jgi:alkylresorcinol/alkylpyrone synthase